MPCIVWVTLHISETPLFIQYMGPIVVPWQCSNEISVIAGEFWCWSRSFHCRTWRNFLFRFCSWKPPLLLLLFSASGSWVSDEPRESSRIGLYWQPPCPLAPTRHSSILNQSFSSIRADKRIAERSQLLPCRRDNFRLLSKRSLPLLYFAYASYFCSLVLLQRSLCVVHLQLSCVPASTSVGACQKILSSLRQKGFLQTDIPFGRGRMTSEPSAAWKRHSLITYDCTQWLLLVTHFQMDPPVAAAVIKSCLLSASLGVCCLTVSCTYRCGLQLHPGKRTLFCKMKNHMSTWMTNSWIS